MLKVTVIPVLFVRIMKQCNLAYNCVTFLVTGFKQLAGGGSDTCKIHVNTLIFSVIKESFRIYKQAKGKQKSKRKKDRK